MFAKDGGKKDKEALIISEEAQGFVIERHGERQETLHTAEGRAAWAGATI